MIRYAQKPDIPQLKQLWKEVFQDEDRFVEGFFQECFSYLTGMCKEEAGEIQAMLYGIPCRVRGENGRLENAVYFYALATKIDFRGQGIMTQLVETACRQFRHQGYSCFFLIPAQESLFSYYEILGFHRLDPGPFMYVPIEKLPVQTDRDRAEGLCEGQHEVRSITIHKVSIQELCAQIKGRLFHTDIRTVYFPWPVEEFYLRTFYEGPDWYWYLIKKDGHIRGYLGGRKEGSQFRISYYGYSDITWEEFCAGAGRLFDRILLLVVKKHWQAVSFEQAVPFEREYEMAGMGEGKHVWIHGWIPR